MEGFKNFATIAVHVGSEPEPHTGAVVPSISLATTFSQSSLGNACGKSNINSFGKGFEYIRGGNPTRGAFERAIAACENGAHAAAFSSGLAAASAIACCLKSGDHIICIDDVYGGTQRLFRSILNPLAEIQVTFVDMSNLSNISSAITPRTSIIWIESPTNPTLKVTDIKAVVDFVSSFGRPDIWIVVDNTFFTPYLQQPLGLGASIVLHSCTKYIGGHSDVLMGCLVTNESAIIDKIRFVQNSTGAVPSPFDCYMALRGLKTLHLRMEAAQQNALRIAEFLESNTCIERVIYPGLPSHPNFEIVKKQASGAGAMITFYIKGGIEEASRFLSNLKLFTLAESLGAVESLAESPACMTHASVPAEHRAACGISDSLIRLSIGIEHVADLIQDLSQALEASVMNS